MVKQPKREKGKHTPPHNGLKATCKCSTHVCKRFDVRCCIRYLSDMNPSNQENDMHTCTAQMPPGKIVGGVFLSRNQLLWVEELAVGSGAHLVNHRRFLSLKSSSAVESTRKNIAASLDGWDRCRTKLLVWPLFGPAKPKV